MLLRRRFCGVDSVVICFIGYCGSFHLRVVVCRWYVYFSLYFSFSVSSMSVSSVVPLSADVVVDVVAPCKFLCILKFHRFLNNLTALFSQVSQLKIHIWLTYAGITILR